MADSLKAKTSKITSFDFSGAGRKPVKKAGPRYRIRRDKLSARSE